MSWYGRQVLPRAINIVCGTQSSHDLREQVCAGLTGEVIEIGFGSGHNVAHYPDAVTSVVAVEPSDVAWRLAAERVAASPIPVRRGGLDGQVLAFEDGTFDSALSTWTLCTVPDVAAALMELRRVLKSGGVLHFLEHGWAPDPSVQRWQSRLEPLQKRLAGGCHLTREFLPLLTSAGFQLSAVEEFYEEGSPKMLGAVTMGRALVP